jgi:hypothetical protein
MRKRHTIAMACRSDRLGEELTTRQSTSFGSSAEVFNDAAKAADRDSEIGKLVGNFEGHLRDSMLKAAMRRDGNNLPADVLEMRGLEN